MKIVFSAALILGMIAGMVSPVYGQGGPERKKVGLVLSGGGAKGSAHIGVLKVLEEAGMPIDYIAGTSMGAIVGGLYAAGYSTHELDSMMRAQNWTELLMDHIARDDKPITQKEISDTYLISVDMSLRKKFSLPPGVLAGQSVLNLLNEMTIGFHECRFDSLRIPFACVAYDLVQGQQVVFRHGNLSKAIRASMSIPGAFEPVRIDSMLLVDGGIYNNFPVDVVRSMGADIVIGVDVSAGKQSIEKINTIPGMIDQLTAILSRDKYSENREDVELYIKPDIIPYGAASFSSEAIDTLLNRGEAAGRAKWDEIIAFKERYHLADFHDFSSERLRLKDTDTLYVGNIKFTGLSNNEETLIRYRLHLDENSTITKGQLNNAINRLRGSGAFSYVTYTIDNRSPHTLSILVNEKQQTNVNLGFRFDSEEMASILLNTTINFRGLQGPAAALTVRLNSNPYVKLDLFSNYTRLGRLGLSYMYRHNSYRIYSGGNRISSVAYGQNRVDLYLLDPNPRRLKLNLGVRYEHLNYNSFLFAPDRDYIIVEPEGFLNYFLFAKFETRNNRYFPSSGSSLQVNFMLHTDNGLTYGGGAPFFTVAYDFTKAFRVIPGYRRLVAIPSVYGRTIGGGNVAYSYLNFMGGDMAGRFVDHQLSFIGISNMELFDNSVMAAALDVRMQIYTRNFVYVRCGYAMSNDNFFRMFTERNDTWGLGIKYSYETPLGPISLQLSSSTRDRSLGFYFSLGKTF